MDIQVQEVVPTLIGAIETILNPQVNHAQRQLAHKVCEEFKESSPLCVPVGLALAQTTHKPIVRHFGLQLMEHAIKFRWNDMNQNEKEFLKTSALELIASGTLGILEEEYHIKDAVSRITVELVKREWPQLWPTLLEDLYQLCQMGETQTELVMKVYLRLVEDALLLQTMPHQRRREVMMGLTTSMSELFEFFVTLLKQHVNAADSETALSQPDTKEKHTRVSEAVLNAMAGYLDWVNMNHIISNNGLLLQMLCLLLNKSTLQLSAAECLLIIVSRRGKVEDRKPLLILFSDDAMSIILQTAGAAEKASAQDEYYYLFLKKLCLVIVELGKQLCALWGTISDVERPPNFSKYLEALLAFTQHSSQMISSYTQVLWAMLLRHELMNKDPVLLSFIPRLFDSASRTLLKVGFPSHHDSPSCDYSRHDFDSDEDFNVFFSKFRAEVAETLKLATVLQPKEAFGFASRWLQTTLQKPVNTGTGSETGNCTLSSPSFLEWDAMTLCLEKVMSRVMLAEETKVYVQEGVMLLQSVLTFQTEDALILSSLLSCISALFPFLTHTPETILAVLQKIFSAVTFALPGQTKGTRSRAVKNARQHACSILVKICKQYTELIFPVFDHLYSHIQTISSDEAQLSQMEKCILIEALILISNQFQNFEKQSKFLEEILKPVKELWLSDDYKTAFWQPNNWLSYIGLDQAPVKPSSADTCGINRSHICYCTNMTLAVMKRSKWPDDVQMATVGGFVLCKREDGTHVLRNPATAHVSVLLENLLALFKTMNAVWRPEFQKLRHPEFEKSYELIENEKLAILGVPPPCVDQSSSPMSKQPLDRMQHFLTSTHDNSCHILGNAGQCLGYEFYATPNLSQSFICTVFSNMDFLPDYRIKPIIRVLMKPYIQSCPAELYGTAVIPILEFLCPYLYQRLHSKWQLINQRTSEQDAEENMEAQEVLDDQMTRLLSREYIELIGTAFHLIKKQDKAAMATDDTNMEESEIQVTPEKEESLSELGQLCMTYNSVYPSILMCIFDALSWNDTPSCHRAISLCWSTVKQLFADGKITPEIAENIFCKVLCGLQLHGQHEGSMALLLSLALQIYELLRPTFSGISNVLLQMPNCKPGDVKSFDDKIIQNAAHKQIFQDKKKKEAFKKLVSSVIGKSVGQQFKKESHYKNLPPIFRIKPPKEDVIESSSAGLSDLFKPANGNSG